jgi:DNA-directed RNA polymerase specialized sigma24 family protein
MPASLAPITPELLKDLQGGKEPALEQLFRPNFAALSTEANEKLEDIAVAQKVVASAFLEVWEHRTEPQSPAQLESMLRQFVTAGVTHEVRRRGAAHRMGETEGNHKDHAAKHTGEALTVDQVWARIVGELHTVKTDSRERAKQLADQRRHEAALHMAKVSKRGVPKTMIIIGVVLAVAVAIPLYLAGRGAEMTKAGQALAREDARSMRSQSAQRGTVKLEDSTEVRIGSSTEVRLPVAFPRDFRAAEVRGSALFKAPSGTTPFLVKVGSAWVAAQDADFVVRSYPDDSGAAMIKVLRGHVTVQAGEVEQKSYNEGSVLLVKKDATISDLPAERAINAFSWPDGNFVTQNLPLRKVLVEFKKWYGLDIVPKDTTFLDRPITMSASLESKMDGIAALEAAGKLKLGFEGASMALYDESATVKNPVTKPTAKAAAKKKK